MKKHRRSIMVLAIVMVLCLATGGMAAKEQYVDKGNWETIKDLVPDVVLNWVKTGDMVVRYSTLDFDAGKVVPQWVLESKMENIGKYKLTENKTIVDAATGKPPKFIKGIPFPNVKMSDPDGAEKVIWNGLYMRNANGSLHNELEVKFFGRKTGYERSIWCDWFSKPFEGYEPARSEPNPNNFESANQILIKSPYDMAGTAMMTWRYRTDKENMLYGYVPAIRRVRRLTPSGRSDALFGSDYAQDDGGYVSYDGAVNYFNWKIIGEGDVLGGFISAKPTLVIQNKAGHWDFNFKNDGPIQWSFEKKREKNSGAPWFVDSAVWAKRPVWIVEGIPKDVYYNYGRQIFYIDKENYLCYWKVIDDRTGKHWKTLWTYWAMGQDADKTVSWNAMLITTILDERMQHATAQDGNKNYRCGVNLNSNQFSLAGFTALCK